MDTLPLPPRPSPAQYRKRAKELVKAAESTDDGAVRARAEEWVETLARLRGVTITPFVRDSLDRAVEEIEQRVCERSTLADAQHLMARAHGFASWRDFAHHVEPLSGEGAGADPFEAGADAVVTGDLATLESLLAAQPDLVRARSAREHRATASPPTASRTSAS